MWKDISNWEGLYKINEEGEVYSCRTKKIIRGDKNTMGYRRVTLYDNQRKERYFNHRLVAEQFIDNPNEYREVNHIDGDKANNSIHNLEWCSKEMNERHKRKMYDTYRPFYVVWENGKRVEYDFLPDLANELGVTRRAVLNWLLKIHKPYSRFHISEI